METIQEMGIFKTYGWPVAYRSLSDKKLAAQMRLQDKQSEAVNVKVFKNMVKEAITAFLRCAEKILASEYQARHSNW